MLKTNQERPPSLAGSDCKLPDREQSEWLPETLELLEELLERLQEPTRDLLDHLEAGQPEAFQSLRESVGRFQEAEELLRMLHDFGNATASVTSAGQLAYRLEQALSRLNSLIGGLVASDAASFLDLIHLKRELQCVWHVLREIDKQSSPLEVIDNKNNRESS